MTTFTQEEEDLIFTCLLKQRDILRKNGDLTKAAAVTDLLVKMAEVPNRKR